MRQDKTDCKSIQRTIAAARQPSPLQLAHIEGCPQCAALQHRFQQLDTLVNQATADLVPAGFSERLMARIPRATSARAETVTPVSDRLLAAFSHSRLLRNIAIALAMVLGIGQLVQFILGIFFVSMIAAM